MDASTRLALSVQPKRCVRISLHVLACAMFAMAISGVSHADEISEQYRFFSDRGFVFGPPGPIGDVGDLGGSLFITYSDEDEITYSYASRIVYGVFEGRLEFAEVDGVAATGDAFFFRHRNYEDMTLLEEFDDFAGLQSGDPGSEFLIEEIAFERGDEGLLQVPLLKGIDRTGKPFTLAKPLRGARGANCTAPVPAGKCNCPVGGGSCGTYPNCSVCAMGSCTTSTFSCQGTCGHGSFCFALPVPTCECPTTRPVTSGGWVVLLSLLLLVLGAAMATGRLTG